MEQRLQGARSVLFGSLFVGFAICVPWLGWWPVAIIAFQVALYQLFKPVIARSVRPEYPIAFIVTTAQLEVGAAVALTGGPSRRSAPSPSWTSSPGFPIAAAWRRASRT